MKKPEDDCNIKHRLVSLPANGLLMPEPRHHTKCAGEYAYDI